MENRKREQKHWILFFLTLNQNEITIENVDNSIRGLTNGFILPWKHRSERDVATFDPPLSTEAKIVHYFTPSPLLKRFFFRLAGEESASFRHSESSHVSN